LAAAQRPTEQPFHLPPGPPGGPVVVLDHEPLVVVPALVVVEDPVDPHRFLAVHSGRTSRPRERRHLVWERSIELYGPAGIVAGPLSRRGDRKDIRSRDSRSPLSNVTALRPTTRRPAGLRPSRRQPRR